MASIRYWYPEIPIYLIKDYLNGDFSTSEIEQLWNVRVFETERKTFGWGFSKLEPLFTNSREQFLILDSDIVFIGRVLDYLNTFDSDFVVQFEEKEEPEISQLYFSLPEMHSWDPSFNFPNYTFNSGQIACTGGCISRDDFADLINLDGARISLRHPHVFTMGGDQGILNYVLLKKASANEITISRAPFMKWGEEELDSLELRRIIEDSHYPFLIHWAGLKQPRISRMLRSDILFFFENLYYSHVPLGRSRKTFRTMIEIVDSKVSRLTKRSAKFLNHPMSLTPNVSTEQEVILK